MLTEGLVGHLPLLQVLFQIPIDCVFHHDADVFLFDEGLEVADHIAVVELLHQLYLLQDLLLRFLRPVLDADLLNRDRMYLLHVVALVQPRLHQVHIPEVAMPDLGDDLVGVILAFGGLILCILVVRWLLIVQWLLPVDLADRVEVAD